MEVLSLDIRCKIDSLDEVVAFPLMILNDVETTEVKALLVVHCLVSRRGSINDY